MLAQSINCGLHLLLESPRPVIRRASVALRARWLNPHLEPMAGCLQVNGHVGGCRPDYRPAAYVWGSTGADGSQLGSQEPREGSA